ELTKRLGAIPLTNLRLAIDGLFADVRLPTGAGLSREALDSALVAEAITSGAAFLPATTATVGPVVAADRRNVRLRHGTTDFRVDARIVLAANGLGGKLGHGEAWEPESIAWKPGSRIGAGVMALQGTSEYSPRTIYMACAPEGYVGQVVVEDGRVDVAAALDPAAVKSAGGTGPLAARIVEQ